VGVAVFGVIPGIGMAIVIAVIEFLWDGITSADMLAELEHGLTESGIELRFAEMKDPVKDKLRRFELFDRLGAANFYSTIGSAVDAYLEEHAVDWKP
jgi:MFS superfamily sulfate permease-like transporter